MEFWNRKNNTACKTKIEKKIYILIQYNFIKQERSYNQIKLLTKNSINTKWREKEAIFLSQVNRIC